MLTENPNHWAKHAVRELAIWCTNPTTTRGRNAMMTLRNTKASRHRMSSTVAMEMIFSARLKDAAWSTEMAALPVSWPRSPEPFKKASVSARSVLTAALGPSSPGCPFMAT